MLDPASSLLTPWATFYTMMGSSAAALTGLMFVVITLVTGESRSLKNSDGISTFSTPTVVHFGAVLLVSAVLSAPWPIMVYAAVAVGLAGFCGVAYIVRVMYLATRLRSYRPDAEDWTWFTILPLTAYGSILAGAILLAIAPVKALFFVAGGALLLTFIGIRNSWDVVTYLATGRFSAEQDASGEDKPG